MKAYNVECPVCGHLNHNLYLEETDGWMECENCNAVTRFLKSDDMIRISISKLNRIKLQAATA